MNGENDNDNGGFGKWSVIERFNGNCLLYLVMVLQWVIIAVETNALMGNPPYRKRTEAIFYSNIKSFNTLKDSIRGDAKDLAVTPRSITVPEDLRRLGVYSVEYENKYLSVYISVDPLDPPIRYVHCESSIKEMPDLCRDGVLTFSSLRPLIDDWYLLFQ